MGLVIMNKVKRYTYQEQDDLVAKNGGICQPMFQDVLETQAEVAKNGKMMEWCRLVQSSP